MSHHLSLFSQSFPNVTNLAWPAMIFFFLTLVQSSLINKFTVLLLIFYLLIVNYKELINVSIHSIKAYSLLLFMLWYVASIAWSVTPMTSLLNVINGIEIVFFGLMAAYHARDKDIAASLKVVSIVVIAVVSIYCVISPGDAMTASGFKSFYGQKNNLGFTMALCSLIILLTFKNTFINYIFLSLGISLLFLSQSRTSMILFLFIIFLLALIYLVNITYQHISSYTQGFIRLLTKTIPVVFYMLIGGLIVYREAVADYFITNFPYDTFTGRGLLWVTVLTRTRDDLLIGIGPGAFWTAEGTEASEISLTALSYEQPWVGELHAADGGYIDVIGSLGFIGLGLLLLTIVQAYQFSFNDRSSQIMKLSFALITFFMLHSITETNILMFTNSIWFIFVFFVFYLAYRSSASVDAININKKTTC